MSEHGTKSLVRQGVGKLRILGSVNSPPEYAQVAGNSETALSGPFPSSAACLWPNGSNSDYTTTIQLQIKTTGI